MEKQDYTEKVTYNSGRNREYTTDRIRVSNVPFGYGYRILDLKAKYKQYDGPVVLWEGVDRDEARAAKEAILAGQEIPESKPLVVPTKIIQFNEKHYTAHYSIPTIEDLKKVALKVVNERNDMNYFWKPEEPKAIDITQEVIDTLPASMKGDAKRKLEDYNRAVRNYKTELLDYKDIELALEGDGFAAIRVLNDRQGYQYEEYEIIDPQIVK